MAEDPLSSNDQLEIVCQMLDGDEQGVVRLLMSYGPKVKWLLRRKLGELLTDTDVDSVLNLAATKAFHAASTFNDEYTLGGWFYIIAWRAAIDTVREMPDPPDDREVLPLEYDPVIPPRNPACVEDDPPPDEPAIKDLAEVIEDLGPAQKTIAKADLLVGGEADAEVLAAKLGIPKQSVYSYRNKYKAAIKKRMEKRGHTSETLRRRR